MEAEGIPTSKRNQARTELTPPSKCTSVKNQRASAHIEEYTSLDAHLKSMSHGAHQRTYKSQHTSRAYEFQQDIRRNPAIKICEHRQLEITHLSINYIALQSCTIT
jgi:hypothetical protein